MMHLEYNPEGVWRIVGESIPQPLRNMSRGESGLGDALMWMVGDGLEKEVEPGIAWLRACVRECIEILAVNRQYGEGAPWFGKDWEFVLMRKPTFPGNEYVGVAALVSLGEVLWSRVRAELGWKGGDVSAWLSSLSSHWNLVGRIVLNLAEMPPGNARPFGFIATYVEGVAENGRPMHKPFGRFIQEQREKGGDIEDLVDLLRKASEESAWLRESLGSGQFMRPVTWTVSEAYHFIRAVPKLKVLGLITRMPSHWEEKGPAKVKVKVSVGEEKKSEGRPLWGFSARLALNGEDLTETEWEIVKNAQDGLVLLRGQWVEVDVPRVDRLMTSWGKLEELCENGMSLSMAMRIISGFGWEKNEDEETDEEDEDWSVVEATDSLATCIKELKSQEKSFQVSSLFQGSLRPYQEEGVQWLERLHQQGMGACLADDMGLGKTVQLIAFLCRIAELREKSGAMCSLIVAPVSLLRNWMEEIRKFAPSLKIHLFHGEGAEWRLSLTGMDVILTSYSLIQRREELRNYPWEVVILDEAQAVKNASSLQAKAVSEMRGTMKIALTGTPIENGLSDLWSIFHILVPGLLGKNFSSFYKGIQSWSGGRSYERLRRLISPLVLRRMKTDEKVAIQLPPKTEMIQRCMLTKRQALLYAHLAEELKQQMELQKQQALVQGNEEENEFLRKALVLRYMMRFKQLCNHPSLLNGDNIFDPEDGGKFHRLKVLAQEWAARKEKVIVFTQFREMCAPLAKFLMEIYGEPGLIMHGGVSVAQRQRDVALFQDVDGPPFYVLSLKTAGTGLTLTAARHVVHFDRWWNPAVENQASDRIYRIGQKNPVFIHKFIVLGTMEEKIQAMLTQKHQLATDILGGWENVDATYLQWDDEKIWEFVQLSDRNEDDDE